jgi:hypothetical protein
MNQEPWDGESNDIDSVNTFDTTFDTIDKFISDETDYLLDLYYDLKDRIPYFLDKMHFHHLSDFIIDNKFNTYENNKRYSNLDYFYSEYKTEINAALFVINGYLCKYKKFQITFDTFIRFAYDFTTII